jgi:hypothetical protein
MDGGPGKNPVPIVGAGQATFGITAGGNNVFQPKAADRSRHRRRTRFQRGPYSYHPAAPGIPTEARDLEGKTVTVRREIFRRRSRRSTGSISKVKVVSAAHAEPPQGRVDFFTGCDEPAFPHRAGDRARCGARLGKPEGDAPRRPRQPELAPRHLATGRPSGRIPIP